MRQVLHTEHSERLVWRVLEHVDGGWWHRLDHGLQADQLRLGDEWRGGGRRQGASRLQCPLRPWHIAPAQLLLNRLERRCTALLQRQGLLAAASVAWRRLGGRPPRRRLGWRPGRW